MSPATTIAGFHRVGADDRSVQFTTFSDCGALEKHLRAEQGVYGTPDADQVVLVLEDDGDVPGNSIGTVAVFADDGHRMKTLQRAIGAIEAVLEGLRESGHTDDDSTMTEAGQEVPQ